jgi:hypothetical protein
MRGETMIKWRFPSNDYGENKGINDSGISQFRGTPLKSLAREICQNSLDAATESKIKVKFDMCNIKTKNVPGRDKLKDAFERCLDFWKIQKGSDTKNFFEEAIREIEKEQCAVLRISDFHTTGLTGSREEINTDWTNLTKSSGTSDKRGTAGGSFGIGKFAPFACSTFSTVFYSTYDINDEKAFQGVTRLVTFTGEDERNTQGMGYFGNEKNTPVFKQLSLDDTFCRKEGEYGTDIYILGYKYARQSWKKGIIVSILDGFLGAIWSGKMEVIVGDVTICKNTLEDLFEEYQGETTGFANKYYEVLRSSKTAWKSEDLLGLGEVQLGILLGDQDAPKKVAMIRQTGMKIMDKGLTVHVPFVGVMFINGKTLNERLRLIENPEHNKWQPERAGNEQQARALLTAINSFIRRWIEELISNSMIESIDAVGVGSFIPDIVEDSNNTATEEVVSDRVLEVEIKKIRKKSISQNDREGMELDQLAKGNGHTELGGKEEDWFHNNGHTENKKDKPRTEAHKEDGGSDLGSNKIAVGIEKLTSICVNKENGKYVLVIVPEEDAEDATVELYLSAETGNYKAPLKNATVLGNTVHVKDNSIQGIKLVKKQPTRMSLEIDFYDYCSMEVKMYAITK